MEALIDLTFEFFGSTTVNSSLIHSDLHNLFHNLSAL